EIGTGDDRGGQGSTGHGLLAVTQAVVLAVVAATGIRLEGGGDQQVFHFCRMVFTDHQASTGFVGGASSGQRGGDDTGDVFQRSLGVEVARHHFGGTAFVPAANTVGFHTVGAIVQILNNQCILDGAAVAFIEIDGVVADIESSVVGQIRSTAEELDTIIVGTVALNVVEGGA